MDSNRKGKVITVLGAIEPEALGKTITHEHLSLDFTVAFTPSNEKGDCPKTECDFTLPNLGWIKQNPYSHKKNIQFYGEDLEKLMEEELFEFHKKGGGCIVENTVHGIRRNIKLIKRLAATTGVNIIAGTGYYVAGSQPPSTLKLSREEIAKLFLRELCEGCVDDPTAQCGVLGELGCSWPLDDFEKRVLQAAGEVQEQTGCPVTFHPGRDTKAPEEIIRIYSEAGGAVDKAVMGHLDRTIHTMEELVEFAEIGSFLEYDLFGIETSHYQLNTAIDMPSDAQRIARIKHLTDHGFEDKILLAHDVHTRNRLSAYGGHGFCHIFNSIVPKMLTRELTQEQVDKFLVGNPAKWLTFTK